MTSNQTQKDFSTVQARCALAGLELVKKSTTVAGQTCSLLIVKPGSCMPVHDVAEADLLARNELLSVASGTTTGKTAAIARVVVWFMLCFPYAKYQGKREVGSNFFVGAPSVNTVKDGIFKELADVRQAIGQGPFRWLNDYWTLAAERAFVNGFASSWFIALVAFPKGQTASIAGRHRWNQTIVVDEACGVSDGVFDVLTGTNSMEGNKTILLSQPARTSGFFYRTHTELSEAAGGIWNNLTLSSERSPFVTLEWLKDRENESGGRNSVEYRIRCLGEFAASTDGNLLTREQIMEALRRSPVIGEDEPWGWVVSVDVAMGEFRDYSVATVARVIGYGWEGPDARRVDFVRIPLHSNGRDEVDFAGEIIALMGSLENATLLVDSGGAGSAVCKLIERSGINVTRISWGAPCFAKALKDRFMNQRAQCMVHLRDGIRQGRISLPKGLDKKFEEKLLLQGSRLPYKFTEAGVLRYQMESKDTMRANGIPSPDIFDTFGQVLIEGVSYIPAGGNSSGDNAKASLIDAMNQELDDALSGLAGVSDN